MRDFSFENLLTSYRNRLGLTQQEVANPDDAGALQVSLRTYQGWENGERIPSNKWLHRMASFFQLTEAEADTLYRAAGQVAPEIHNLPFPRNPFFTGRETYLEGLNQHLKEQGSVAITQPISISGLGGIGKTQLALEYAHRCHPKLYRTVLWVNAANKATLEASYLSLASLLQLPEKDEHEADRIVQAVKTWLERHTSWLLILDNADDLPLARSFLPIKSRGHILLTTRSQILGNIAARIEIEALEPEEGLRFLLQRSGALKLGAAPDDITSDICSAAARLVKLLGGHPLALDQAGAYIEEMGVSFDNYLQTYLNQRHILLNERGLLGGEHPETVVVTFEVSFKRACELYPAAADVLHFCSFLYPDGIPEELLSQDNGLKLNTMMIGKAIAALRRYSLIKRNAEKNLLSVHRLVQAVLQDTLAAETKKQWMQRAVQAVSIAFPRVEFAQWAACERYLQHALLCVAWIEQEQMTFPEVIRLLDQTGTYLTEQARYAEAEPLYKRALTICEQQQGPERFAVVHILNNLALLYYKQEKYGQAEPLYMRALAIYGQLCLVEHPAVATALDNLAQVYERQGKYAEAEPLCEYALAIRWKYLGPKHRATACSLNNLAVLSERQGRYERAESLYQDTLAISEQHLGPEHPDMANSLNNLAEFYHQREEYERAEPLYERALAIYEQSLGPNHPSTRGTRGNYVSLLQAMGRDEDTTWLETISPPTAS